MVIRSRAPLRIGLAGGGTDVSPYCDEYGGAILNATISMYAYATIEPTTDGYIELNAVDCGAVYRYPSAEELPIDGNLDLLKGVYNRILKDYKIHPLSFKLSTWVDAPPGSGLGTSSTLVVALLGAFSEWLKLPLGEYDLASLAYKIERHDLGMAGGKQDQYAATFGGFNFMEFSENDKVIVNPLRIRESSIRELEFCLLLYFTGKSRSSARIIEAQAGNVISGKQESVEAMHQLRKQAVLMKEAILRGENNEIGRILDFGWQFKKQTAAEVSSSQIDEIYSAAMAAGSTGGKISGAGGGGFMMFYCPETTRYAVIDALSKFGGEFRRFNFINEGVLGWTVSKRHVF